MYFLADSDIYWKCEWGGAFMKYLLGSEILLAVLFLIKVNKRGGWKRKELAAVLY